MATRLTVEIVCLVEHRRHIHTHNRQTTQEHKAMCTTRIPPTTTRRRHTHTPDAGTRKLTHRVIFFTGLRCRNICAPSSSTTWAMMYGSLDAPPKSAPRRSLPESTVTRRGRSKAPATPSTCRRARWRRATLWIARAAPSCASLPFSHTLFRLSFVSSQGRPAMSEVWHGAPPGKIAHGWSTPEAEGGVPPPGLERVLPIGRQQGCCGTFVGGWGGARPRTRLRRAPPKRTMRLSCRS